jgi:site-specific DNA-methyltransferase (adenine-specific)
LNALLGIPEPPDNWFTPADLFNEIEEKYGPFDMDVAASSMNTKCAVYITEQQNALECDWRGSVWCNPPYVKLIEWVRKAYLEVKSGRCSRVTMLLPAQTSTNWFHDYALKYGELYWIRGKRKFGGRSDQSIMPSVVVVFDGAKVGPCVASYKYEAPEGYGIGDINQPKTKFLKEVAS